MLYYITSAPVLTTLGGSSGVAAAAAVGFAMPSCPSSCSEIARLIVLLLLMRELGCALRTPPIVVHEHECKHKDETIQAARALDRMAWGMLACLLCRGSGFALSTAAIRLFVLALRPRGHQICFKGRHQPRAKFHVRSPWSPRGCADAALFTSTPARHEAEFVAGATAATWLRSCLHSASLAVDDTPGSASVDDVLNSQSR